MTSFNLWGVPVYVSGLLPPESFILYQPPKHPTKGRTMHPETIQDDSRDDGDPGDASKGSEGLSGAFEMKEVRIAVAVGREGRYLAYGLGNDLAREQEWSTDGFNSAEAEGGYRHTYGEAPSQLHFVMAEVPFPTDPDSVEVQGGLDLCKVEELILDPLEDHVRDALMERWNEKYYRGRRCSHELHSPGD